MNAIAFNQDTGWVPTVDFQYPDEGDEPAPVVREPRRQGSLVDKCQRRFAVVPSNDPMTRPLLDKRLEVLTYAIRDAVETGDFNLIQRLTKKALATRARIATEQLAASTPETREDVGGVVIHDNAAEGKVIISFGAPLDERERRWLQICGFFGCGDRATYWRKRTFRRGENIALDHARMCVERLIADRAKLKAQEDAEDEAEWAKAKAIAAERDRTGRWR